MPNGRAHSAAWLWEQTHSEPRLTLNLYIYHVLKGEQLPASRALVSRPLRPAVILLTANHTMVLGCPLKLVEEEGLRWVEEGLG